MDTISVFSSFIVKNKLDFPLLKLHEVNEWLKKKDKKYNLKIKIKPLIDLKHWQVKPSSITHKNNKHFSIVGIKINANKREIKETSKRNKKEKSKISQ